MIERRFPIIVSIVLIFVGSACTTYTPVANGDNFVYLYGKGAAAMRLQARVYHSSDDRSVIWFKLRTRDLLYKNRGDGGPFHAQVLITYEAYPAIGNVQLLDSSSTYVRDASDNPDEDKELIGSMDMKRSDRRSFVIKVTAHDLNRDVKSSLFIQVEKHQHGQRQGFLPMSTRGVPLFDDHVSPGTQVHVMCEQYADASLTVEHFKPQAKLPPPVFTESSPVNISTRPDSVFTIRVDKDGWFDLVAAASGFYHVRSDTSQRAGYTLFTLKDSYPAVRVVRDMVAPLRYITSTQEWDKLTDGDEPRKEVEKFWSTAAGDRERARQAIEAYYSRVESADRHFTSIVEGWKTDRGLVHIIFGTPNTIRKTDTGETWIYGDESNLMSLIFNFVKRDDPFTDNDLVLQRDPMFKSAWYRNVESWRNGRIFQN